MSAAEWVQGLRGTPDEEATRLLASLEKSAGRPTNEEEVEALAWHFEQLAVALGWHRVEQLRSEAATAFNAWLAKNAVADFPRLTAANITETAACAGAWLIELDVDAYRNMPALPECDTRIEALKQFIACSRGEL